MIDRALGIEPVRRRKADNTSETEFEERFRSSKHEDSSPVNKSPARYHVRKFNSGEQIQKDDDKTDQTFSQTGSRPKRTFTTPRQESGNSSDEEIASPAIKNLKLAHVAKTKDELRSSGKAHLRESIRPEVQVNKSIEDDTMYKLKILGFLIISLLLMLNAMTPDRKVSGGRR